MKKTRIPALLKVIFFRKRKTVKKYVYVSKKKKSLCKMINVIEKNETRQADRKGCWAWARKSLSPRNSRT